MYIYIRYKNMSCVVKDVPRKNDMSAETSFLLVFPCRRRPLWSYYDNKEWRVSRFKMAEPKTWCWVNGWRLTTESSTWVNKKATNLVNTVQLQKRTYNNIRYFLLSMTVVCLDFLLGNLQSYISRFNHVFPMNRNPFIGVFWVGGKSLVGLSRVDFSFQEYMALQCPSTDFPLTVFMYRAISEARRGFCRSCETGCFFFSTPKFKHSCFGCSICWFSWVYHQIGAIWVGLQLEPGRWIYCVKKPSLKQTKT